MSLWFDILKRTNGLVMLQSTLVDLILLALLVTIWSFLVLVAKCVDCFIILSTKNVYCFSCTIKKGDSSQANDNILLKMIVPYFILEDIF